jgi:pyruvate/2-oxoglutarate dehydrogenase complex dihydrolipoamide dehydrogenase (E3) component
MAVDYNLVVIGSSIAGIEAAKTAVSQYARVALIAQDEPWDTMPIALTFLRELANCSSSLQACGLVYRSPQSAHPIVDWPKAAQYLQLLTAQQQAQYSFDRLASLGIDVIAGSGAFQRKPRFGFEVDDRLLTSNAYLLACSNRIRVDSSIVVPFDISNVMLWELESLPQQLAKLQQVKAVTILGDSPQAVAIAQFLAKLGMTVTLSGFAQDQQFDETLMRLLQAQLEIDGVKFSDQIQEVSADLILIAAGETRLDVKKVEQLNLTAARVRWNKERIYTDRYHRANRKVYCCGTSMELGQRAVGHALKLSRVSRSQSNKSLSPVQSTCIPSNPPLVAIGFTETQAQNQYGAKVQVLTKPIDTCLKAQLTGKTTGLCKLVIHPKGRILGGHILAEQADEWASVIELAIQQGMTIEQLVDLMLPSPSFVELLVQMAREYKQQKMRSRLEQYALEEFLSWQRYWGK